MKKLFCLLISLASIAGANAQTVGIGTTTPNTNAILDIFSANKGVLIPRIVDTGTVPNPLEGMIIYNRNTKTPYYHNGQQWVSLGGRLPGGVNGPGTDRITYTICGPGWSCTELEILSFSQGASNPVTIGGGGITPGNPSLSSFNFMKVMDINSNSLNLYTIVGTKFPSIEIKFYATGQMSPFISYRLQNIIFESYQVSGTGGSNSPLIESFSVMFENYGFKDWENNKEFGYNVITKTVTAY